MLGCCISLNKASQGLFVLSTYFMLVSSRLIFFYWVVSIRYALNHFIFHAGHYLCDKELCYLWTVIVTANVYFSIDIGCILLPTIKNLKLLTMFLLNSHFIISSSSVLSKSYIKFQVFMCLAFSYFFILIYYVWYLLDKKTCILT